MQYALVTSIFRISNIAYLSFIDIHYSMEEDEFSWSYPRHHPTLCCSSTLTCLQAPHCAYTCNYAWFWKKKPIQKQNNMGGY